MSKQKKKPAAATKRRGRPVKAARAKTPKSDQRMPRKVSAKTFGRGKGEEGPRAWFLPQIESAYSRLSARGAAALAAPKRAGRGKGFTSSYQPGKTEEILEPVAPTTWLGLLAEYKRRKAAAQAARKAMPVVGVAALTAPAIPGARNWLPLGPSVVLDGQTVGAQPVAGRVAGIAVAPGGQIVLAASACGGVFRSDDGGTTWQSLMDSFDIDPTNFASTSLACGAIAIDPVDPQRIYVGTGEGDTNQIFQSRIVNALPAYRGIGPISSTDGGQTWSVESTAADSPQLAGEAFFELAVDPINRDQVVGATSKGLYRRGPKAGGGFEWAIQRPNVHCSVVVAFADNTAHYFAAEWGVGVFHSTDGAGWAAVGTGFPTANVDRIALAVPPNNPDVLYAFVAKPNGTKLGVFRLDGVGGAWKSVANVPDVLPLDKYGHSQGDYDLAIAVDPGDVNLIFLAGSYDKNADPGGGSIWRCRVQPSGNAFRIVNPASIGTHAHADVHVIIHTPGDPTELWCGCDGGVYLNRSPGTDGEFASQNNGLACLCSNFFAQHPTDPNILITGLQDNGTARTDSGPIWKHVFWGDGGYCVINWADPNRVLVFMNGTVWRATDGGASHDSWSDKPVWDFGWATMTQPVVTTPYNPDTPAEAEIVAVGAGNLVFVSPDFGTAWPTNQRIDLGNNSGDAFALAFASPDRLFIGTATGQVFRADRTDNSWSLTRIDDAAAGPLGVAGLISDIGVDWGDGTLNSIYVAFGGAGDRRHVWRFDGTQWQDRSGPDSPGGLLNVEHNALIVDRAAPNNIYAGADIGVWHSLDSGANWAPMENGLPDAPVYDLQIHPTQRLLRATTHGRGLYEIPL
jgi:hypothetical protein